jgi:hypothetical protein
MDRMADGQLPECALLGVTPRALRERRIVHQDPTEFLQPVHQRNHCTAITSDGACRRVHVPVVRSVQLPAFAEGYGEARRSALRARRRQPDRWGFAYQGGHYGNVW